MTWLFSLYWIGILAVAGPILFHMWRRTPRGERRFSTLMFVTSSPPRVTSRSRIEHWVLLLLRAAALALIAFAFTRPLWRTESAEPGGSPQQKLLAILVDTSASMRRTGIWDEMIRELESRISKLPDETFVALYRFDRDLVPVADFNELKSMEPAARREIVKSRLKELKPSWFDTRLGEALVRSATALQEAQSIYPKTVGQQIWLASDLQIGSEVLSLQGFEWPEDLPVEVIPVRAMSSNNAGIQLVEPNADSNSQSLRVRITNAAESKTEQFSLKWDIPQSTEIPVYVPPGQSRIIAPPELPSGVTSHTLLLRGDENDFDNRVYASEETVETRLIVYCGPDGANDIEGERFYLERVFSASQRLEIDLMERHEVSKEAPESKISLVVLTQPEPEARGFVHDHLEKGGTVVVASPSAESMLASLQMCGRQNLAVSEATVANYAMYGNIDFEHPVFAPFAESQFSDFTGIRFWKHRSIKGLKTREQTSSDESDGDVREPDRILARFDDGDPAIIEFAVQRGRVVVFTAGWQPADSQFARSSKFPMLMFQLLEYAAGSTTRHVNHTVGNAIAWPRIDLPDPAATGKSRLPDGTELSSQSMAMPFSQTESPGLYTLEVPGRTEQFAVNLSADESRTTPIPPEQLEMYGLKLTTEKRPQEKKLIKDQQRQLQLAEIEQSQKLWQTLLFVVMVLLLVETFLGGVFRSKIPTSSA